MHSLFVYPKSNSMLLGKRKFGIWKGLYDLPSIELSSYISRRNLFLQTKEWKLYFSKIKVYKLSLVSKSIKTQVISSIHIRKDFEHVKI